MQVDIARFQQKQAWTDRHVSYAHKQTPKQQTDAHRHAWACRRYSSNLCSIKTHAHICNRI